MGADKQSSVCNVLEKYGNSLFNNSNPIIDSTNHPKSQQQKLIISSGKAVRVTDKIKATVFVFYNKYREKIEKNRKKGNFAL